ncbi:MAG: DUF4255 domain-containing protein [Gemmatimonadota bacterium]|nr:MAG: DUF4255 domain-containing protein [Gemmatimonadota bacterium]
MSNFLAIATVTATLRQLLEAVVSVDVSGAQVTTVSPNELGNDTPATGVNVFLYQVTPNAAWRNSDLPTRGSEGGLMQRPQVALDLHYLLTFSGIEEELEPQRLLGSVVRTLHARPILTRQMIQNTVASLTFLAGSNLADEVELIKFAPIPFSLEELSKLWSVFFQTPYVLSVSYQGTVVLIESEVTPQTPLPVLDRNLYVVPFRRPVIERVFPQAGERQPVVAGSTLIIQGRQLKGDVTRILIFGEEVTPQEVSDTRISLQLASPPLPADVLRAGVHGVQVVQKMLMGTPPVEHRGVESNVAAFVLHPTITSISASSTEVSLQVDPDVGKEQRVVLLLNERSTTEPAAYSFVAPTRTADTGSIQIPISGVKSAEYFVRLQVDGAESPIDLDPASSHFGPTVTIP